MYDANAFDEIAESQTLAAAASTTASPLAEVAATPVAAVMEPETHLNIAVAAPAPAAAVIAPTTAVVAPVSTSLGTLPSSTSATLPMLGALLLVVGLILLLGKLVKRVQGARAGQGAALSIKGGVQIGSKERVVWMQAGDTHLLLGVSPGRVQTLHVFDVAPDFSAAAANQAATASAANTPATRDFAERLKSLLARAQAKGIDTEQAESSAATAVAAARARAASSQAAEPMRAAAAKPAESMLAATSKPIFSFRA